MDIGFVIGTVLSSALISGLANAWLTNKLLEGRDKKQNNLIAQRELADRDARQKHEIERDRIQREELAKLESKRDEKLQEALGKRDAVNRQLSELDEIQRTVQRLGIATVLMGKGFIALHTNPGSWNEELHELWKTNLTIGAQDVDRLRVRITDPDLRGPLEAFLRDWKILTSTYRSQEETEKAMTYLLNLLNAANNRAGVRIQELEAQISS